ncbi:hypothetical protein HNR29_006143 [Rhizobium leguminosarum]|nr:hypothetical protein [Rhizobium leguminosarum]MBA9035568.1 hypothetical protein [Rhizobium leguminosarum]
MHLPPAAAKLSVSATFTNTLIACLSMRAAIIPYIVFLEFS